MRCLLSCRTVSNTREDKLLVLTVLTAAGAICCMGRGIMINLIVGVQIVGPQAVSLASSGYGAPTPNRRTRSCGAVDASGAQCGTLFVVALMVDWGFVWREALLRRSNLIAAPITFCCADHTIKAAFSGTFFLLPKDN